MSEKEYIERGALISILDAKSEMAMGTPKAVFASVSKMVELLPAADVVEVVRCKYCKYVSDLGMSGLFCDHPDNRNPCGCRPNDFCNEGERKDATDNNVGDK